jgi:hypothetical protein
MWMNSSSASGTIAQYGNVENISNIGNMKYPPCAMYGYGYGNAHGNHMYQHGNHMHSHGNYMHTHGNQCGCQYCSSGEYSGAGSDRMRRRFEENHRQSMNNPRDNPRDNERGNGTPTLKNIIITKDDDPFSDPIKKQDAYHLYDPLTYPQQRLPRYILQQYMDFFEKNGKYPPFGYATQPYLFDNPTSVGYLTKIPVEGENDFIPVSIPLFMVRSSKNTNRYFYYILDQKPTVQISTKIPLDTVKVNGIKYSNADFYGIPELFDNDVIEDIPIYPGRKFTVKIYKTYFFP